ncbi:FAD-dependent oxidoreductase [Plantactinospora endophytica]|uniref:Monooxygenase n=1 Tax=Plantactinospora endophytica TaxID=673535 RepID=A0ABQ4EAZ7_9ACTN|nr:FAD-dependent monooxygenase [Plantactinospora endophytica]GIG91456.1 monooxygenase [Plantactinospora endophytica]
MKAVIIGAGVSGTLTAVGLARAGHDVEIYERAPQLRDGGNGVMVWHNGTGIMKDLGLRLDGLGQRIDAADVWSYDGRPLMRTDMAEIADELGTPGLGVMRGQVMDRAVEALPPGVLRFGKKCVRIEEAGTGVVAHFDDGTTANGDVLIGADGYRSVVRRHLVGDVLPRAMGLASWHGTTQVPIGLGSEHVVPTYYGRVGLCTIHPVGQGLIHWAFEVPWTGALRHIPAGAETADAAERPVAGSRLATLRKGFGDWAPPVRELLDALTEDDIAVAPHLLHRVAGEWGRGRVTLVGDAAHVVPPRIGMGVNQALEDAWVLSRTTAAADDPALALRRYEQIRRPRAKRIHSTARMMQRANPLLLALRRTRKGVNGTKMLRANIVRGSSFLNDDVR